MADKLEQLNVETSGGGSIEKTDYSKILGKEKQDIGAGQIKEDQQQADELLKKITEGTTGDGTKGTKNTTSILPNEITKTIDNLSRPTAQEGIKQSYASIENDIKKSKNESGIAGFFGKIMNKILG